MWHQVDSVIWIFPFSKYRGHCCIITLLSFLITINIGDIVKWVEVYFVSHRENIFMREVKAGTLFSLGSLRHTQTLMQPHAYECTHNALEISQHHSLLYWIRLWGKKIKHVKGWPHLSFVMIFFFFFTYLEMNKF